MKLKVGLINFIFVVYNKIIYIQNTHKANFLTKESLWH